MEGHFGNTIKLQSTSNSTISLHYLHGNSSDKYIRPVWQKEVSRSFLLLLPYQKRGLVDCYTCYTTNSFLVKTLTRAFHVKDSCTHLIVRAGLPRQLGTRPPVSIIMKKILRPILPSSGSNDLKSMHHSVWHTHTQVM